MMATGNAPLRCSTRGFRPNRLIGKTWQLDFTAWLSPTQPGSEHHPTASGISIGGSRPVRKLVGRMRPASPTDQRRACPLWDIQRQADDIPVRPKPALLCDKRYGLRDNLTPQSKSV